ncbi:MAG: L-methionine (R)-S-oxide reductase [Kiritimatiellia bacterium]|jgi:L-methionine (R)-S-oxide reductase
MLPALPPNATLLARTEHYRDVRLRLGGLLDGEDDWIAAMASVACELHHAFAAWHWTGFYRAVGDDLLIVGPYQGTHGCLRIPFDQGVCGAAATTRQTQLVHDVHSFAGHIGCSSTTNSEIVVPVLTPSGRLLAVLDVDSDLNSAFDLLDQRALEAICADLGSRFGS